MKKVRKMFTQEEISKRVKYLGEALTHDYKDTNPLFVCVLKGASVFFADIIRNVKTDIETDFITVSSYGDNIYGSEIRFVKDLETDIAGRKVVIVEDIVDTGNTVEHLIGVFDKRGAESIAVCCLLDKFSRRTAEIKIDYVGFEIPDEFVVGYGLDYAEKYRNESEIWVLGE